MYFEAFVSEEEEKKTSHINCFGAAGEFKLFGDYYLVTWLLFGYSSVLTEYHGPGKKSFVLKKAAVRCSRFEVGFVFG